MMLKPHYALALLALAVGSAQAGIAREAAELHIRAIASHDIDALSGHYRDDARLNWVGGPLDGHYDGVAAIMPVWQAFTDAQGMIKAEVEHLDEAANGKGSTVIATVRFDGRQALRVRYVLVYRGGRIVDETWQVIAQP